MKNRRFQRIIVTVVILLMAIYILNIKVSTRQGINYKLQSIELPLYLKMLDSFDRHHNYKLTVVRMTGDSKTEEERALKIFEWTYKNIRSIPDNFPVIDDHVWYTIVRGYGTNDQSSDVFTTLCNYAGMDAFYEWAYTQDRSARIPLSFVKVNERWNIFDPHNGVYFKNHEDRPGVNEIPEGKWQIEYIDKQRKIDTDYPSYLKNLPSLGNMGLRRANIQSPLNRLKYEIRKWSR